MSKEKRITVAEFVDGYNKLTSDQLKEKYIKKHVITTYAPLLTKRNVLQIMNDKSVVEENIKYIDLTVSKLNLVMAILVLYTDIEPDKDEVGKPITWTSYDALKSTGLLEQLLECIGSDIDELFSVQKDILDTWHMRNNSPEAYVANLTGIASQRFGVAASVGMEKLTELLNDEKKVEKIMSILEKAIKKIKQMIQRLSNMTSFGKLKVFRKQ